MQAALDLGSGHAPYLQHPQDSQKSTGNLETKYLSDTSKNPMGNKHTNDSRVLSVHERINTIEDCKSDASKITNIQFARIEKIGQDDVRIMAS